MDKVFLQTPKEFTVSDQLLPNSNINKSEEFSAAFCKSNSMVLVNAIIHCRTKAFWGNMSCGSRYLYRH